MSKWEKLLREIRSLSRELRFDELRRVLESYGYMMCAPRGGSSHYTFRNRVVGRSQCQSMNQSKESM